MGLYGTPRIPPGYVDRPRLTTVLNAETPLVVVRGEAGSGKTVAIAEWASEAAVTGVWFTVDRGSSTRLAFWTALADLLRDARIASPGSILGDGISALDAEDDPRRLILRAFAQLPDQISIVIDDFGRVTDATVHDDLIALLQASPRLKVIVSTRAMSGFDSAAVRLSLAPTMVNPEQLRLAPSEVSGALALAQVADADGTIADVLLSAVGGHPLLTRGIIVALAGGEGSIDIDTLAETVEVLGSRLLREVILAADTMTDELRSAVVCSVPAVLTVELVEQLTGRADADAFLSRLESQGWGVWANGTAGLTFTLSPLLRKALRSELEARFPDQISRLARSSAEWCSQHNRPMAALNHALDAGDLELASDVVLHHWTTLLGLHRDASIALLNPLSLRQLSNQPLLAMLLALAHNASGSHRIRAFELFALASASARLRKNKEAPPRRLVLLLVESTALRLLGRGQSALTAAERARSLLEELSVEDRDSLGATLTPLLNHTGITFLYGGRLHAAMTMFETAVTLPSDNHRWGEFHAWCLVAGTHAINGQMAEAARTVAHIRGAQWPEDLVNGYRGAFLHLAEAHLALERFDFGAAREHVAVMAPHRLTIEHWPLFAHVDVMALLGRNDAHKAYAELDAETARHAPVATPVARERLESVRALLCLATGNIGGAERLFKAHPRAMAVNRVQLELLRSQPDRAMRALHTIDDSTEQSVRARCELLLLRGAVALRLDRAVSALAAVDEAVALLNQHQLRMPLLMLPRFDAEALSAALDDRGPSPAGELLRESTAYPRLLPEVISSVDLSERELVVLGVLASTDSVETIAAELYVSKNTVKSQLRSVYRKLGVGSRDDALSVASELRLIS